MSTTGASHGTVSLFHKVPCSPPVQPSPWLVPGFLLSFWSLSWESGQAGSRIHTLGMRRPGFGDEGMRTLRTGQPGRDRPLTLAHRSRRQHQPPRRGPTPGKQALATSFGWPAGQHSGLSVGLNRGHPERFGCEKPNGRSRTGRTVGHWEARCPAGSRSRWERLQGGHPALSRAGEGWAGCLCVHWCPLARRLAGLACCCTRILLSSAQTIPYMNKCFLLCVDCCPGGQDRRPHQLAVRAVGRQRGSPVSPLPPQGHLSADRVPQGARPPQSTPPTFDQPQNPHPPSCQLVLTVGGPSRQGGSMPPSSGWTWAQG